MIKVCLVGDCHFSIISWYLYKNLKFCEKYDSIHVSINKYLNSNYIDYTDDDKKQIREADILILQYIENDRGFLNNCETLKLADRSSKSILIPHYRCSIYNDGMTKISYRNINNIENVSEAIKIIKNEIDTINKYSYDLDQLENFKNQHIAEFLKINSYSNIDMSHYFMNNYQSKRLFQARGYPSSIFFYELSNRLLTHIGINEYVPFVDSYFAENTAYPIFKYWYDFCGFTFENKFYTYGHIEMQDYEYYYMICYLKNSNIQDIQLIKKICSKIRSTME